MNTMRGGVYHGNQQFSVSTLERPQLADGEALIRVAYGGICGTDMMIYAGKHPRARFPLVMGHEFSGTVVETTDASTFRPGDQVVVEPTLSCGRCEACAAGQSHVCLSLRLIGIDSNGGFAEYAKAPLHRLHKIPNHLPLLTAALAEPLAVAVHALRRSSFRVGQNVAILGCGPIGLLTGLVAKHAGAKLVMVSDISPYRLAIARELGLTSFHGLESDIVKEMRDLTDGQGADIVFEAAGTVQTAKQMLEVARIQAEVMVVSVFKNPPPVEMAVMHFKEITINSTRCYTRSDFRCALDLMAAGAIDVTPLISHVLPLERIAEGFELMRNPEESLKIVFQP